MTLNGFTSSFSVCSSLSLPRTNSFPVTYSCWQTYLTPVRADLPVGAQSELTGLCGLWGGQVGATLGVNHGGPVSEALSALELPLLQPGATGHAAL